MSLYNKYRPRKFEDVAQPSVVKLLQAQIITDSDVSSYLLSGPSGTGKTTLARIMAMSLLCSNREKGQAEPCGVCSSCKQIINDANRDVVEINCATNGGVGDIRDLLAEKIRIQPMNGDYRIFILDECHMLTKNSQNALLKMIEEPPSYVKFFLCTTGVTSVIETIKNRCQCYNLTKVSKNLLKQILQKIVEQENIEVEEKGIELIVESANGSPRSAISLLETVAPIGATEDNVRESLAKAPRKIAINLLKAIQKQDRADAYQIILAADAEGRDLPSMIEECCRILVKEVTYYRLFNKQKPEDPDIVELLTGFNGPQIVESTVRLLKTNTEIRQNVPADLIIPMSVLNVIDRYAKLKELTKKAT